jgi:hypothetical protein
MRLGNISIALLLVGSILGCRTSTEGPSVAASRAPLQTPTTTFRAAETPEPPLGLQIDARRVLSAVDCTGGPLGGEADTMWSYEVWTLHCPAEPDGRALVNALRAEAELLGATIDGETEIVSHNPGNDGDQQMTLECQFGDVDIRIRVTVLRETGGSSVVVTIDQRKG